MADYYNSRNPRYRRRFDGRLERRGRLLPRHLRNAPSERSGFTTLLLRLLLGALLCCALFALVGVGTTFAAYNQLAQSLKPRIESVEEHDSFQTTRIYDRNNTLLYEFVGSGRRTQVPLEQISTHLISATISIEDKTFYENQGVDYLGILKALYRSLQAGEETGGASTITQQLVRGVILTPEELAPENRYRRKIIEILLAQELTRQYSKDEILELYLNEIYYGNLAYGIEAAADVYFNTHAKDLTLAQASLLAGLPQLPNVYDPINYLENGVLPGIQLEDGWLEKDYKLPEGTAPPKARQAAVLTQMVLEGRATEAEARAAFAEDLHFADQIVPLNAPHFVFYVRRLLEENPDFGAQFANQGLSIYTTIDLELQRMVQEEAKARITELEERNIHNAAVVVMQPNTGEILAMVGSIDYNMVKPTTTPGQKGNVLDGQVNVTTRERQPGSALKPFTYLAAMEQGMTPGTVLWDVPTEFPPFGPNSYKPENYNGRWNGPLRMRTALANSLNMPAVKALKAAGINETLDLLHRVGINGLRNGADYYGLALTLGGGEVTPLDLTTAYNTLASGGRYYPPVAIRKIVDGNGKVIQEYKPNPGPQVLDPDLVAIITDMLSDDQARRPIWGLNSKLKLSRPAAVKTGTTNDWKDAWAVGYTPYVTVGVWTGNNNNEETAKVESINGGGAIWHNVMERMFSDPHFERLLAEPFPNHQLPINFVLPPTVVERPICQLPGPFNGQRTELFSIKMLREAEDARRLLGDRAPTRGAIDGCDVFQEVIVAKLSDAPVSNEEEEMDEGGTPFVREGQYCKPVEGVDIPAEMLVRARVWNPPPPDEDERVTYRWEGSGGLVASNIPPCTNEMIAAIAPPGSVRMPDLRNYGENQAKEILAALGIFDIYVDYQDRTRAPDLYDSVPAYAVLSTIPAPGDWIKPGMTVVLGIRAPDEQPPPPEQQPPDQQQPPPEQQPPPDQQQPPPDQQQPPPDQPQPPADWPTPVIIPNT